MPYIMPAQRMAFFFSPKAGGTSLRAFLLHAENGFAFRDYSVQGTRMDANMLVANYRFNRVDHTKLKGYRCFALLRDPVKRFSCRLLFQPRHALPRVCRPRRVRARDLLREVWAPIRSLATFSTIYIGYLRCSKPLAGYFSEQQKFIGPDPAAFTSASSGWKTSTALSISVNAECGSQAKMPRLQEPVARNSIFFALDEETCRSAFSRSDRHDIAFSGLSRLLGALCRHPSTTMTPTQPQTVVKTRNQRLEYE